jgi:hypothetical protein
MNFPMFDITFLLIIFHWARFGPMCRLVHLPLLKEATGGGLTLPEVTLRVHTRLRTQSL